MITTTGAFSGFSVDDLDAAAAFSRDIRGLPVETRPMGLRRLLDGTTVFVDQRHDHEPAGFTVLNLQVPDIDAAVGELSDAGIALERYPGMPQDGSGIMRRKAAGIGPDIGWFVDPARNVVAVLAE